MEGRARYTTSASPKESEQVIMQFGNFPVDEPLKIIPWPLPMVHGPKVRTLIKIQLISYSIVPAVHYFS